MTERISRRSTWEERSRNQKERRSDSRREVQRKTGRIVEDWRNDSGHKKEESRYVCD